MSSLLDDGWGDDDDLDVSEASPFDDGWGDDNDLFGDDEGGDDKEDADIGFPPAAPAPALSSVEAMQSNDVWGDDDDLFGDDGSDDEEDADLGFPPAATAAAKATAAATATAVSSSEAFQSDNGWDNDDDLFGDDEEDAGLGFPPAATATTEAASNSDAFRSNNDKNASMPTPTTTTQNHGIPMSQSLNVAVPKESDSMVSKLSNYVNSLDRMLSSINAVLEFEYNTYQKAEELVEYYEKRPQLADYTRTKELQRMNYEVVLPNGYVEANKERIIDEHLLPDDAITSRAANQSLLADLLQVITGHDLIVRPQYLTTCIATWCKFKIHYGDHGNMIDCRAHLSLFLPTEEGDRLNIAEVTVSVIFSPSQPMVEFKVLKIEVLLKDFSKLHGVAAFLSAMGGNDEDHQLMDTSPDIYRDAFLEKSQRFFSLSSEGMKSAFQQMDSVINLKGKIQSISSFIPDTDQVLAAEQEAMAFAQQQQQQNEHAFPRPPISQFPRPPTTQEHAFPRPPTAQFPRPPTTQEHAFPRPLTTQFPRPPTAEAPNLSSDPSSDAGQTDAPDRPQSILGGLVRTGWKTLASSVAIPDDDPAIYGEFAPSSPPRGALYNKPDQPMALYRRKEDVRSGPKLDQPMALYRREEDADSGPKLYRNDGAENAPIPNQGQNPQMNYQRDGGSNIMPQPDKMNEIETLDQNVIGALVANEELQSARNRPFSAPSEQSNSVVNLEPEPSFQPVNRTGSITELGEEKDQNVDQNADKEEVGENFEDGWDDDDFGDDLDDISDNAEESLDQRSTSPGQHQGGEKFLNDSSDVVLLDSEKAFSSNDTKFGEDDDRCETRKRWMNPRPYRPYLRY
jgi:hypothetical protein